MDSRPEWHEAHFCNMASQTTVYSLQKLRTENGTSKFLFSSIDSDFSTVEYQTVGDRITPLTKRIQFTNLPMPGNAEIISIGAFERLPPRRGLVIGVTYVIPQEQDSRPVCQALNIYSANTGEEEEGENTGKENKLEVVADNCESLSLSFIPFYLAHSVVKTKSDMTEPVFLLSGSDFKIHAYREVMSKEPEQQPGVCELSSAEYFPEFTDLPCNVVHFHMINPEPHQRVTAMGHQDGTITVHQVDTQTLEILKVWSTQMDSPISSVHFFTQRKPVPVPSSLESILEETNQVSPAEEDPDLTRINLLMTTTLQPALVYRDVLSNGLSEALSLPDSDKYDAPTCGMAADLDFDGEHEVLVGTYGQELLVYKFFPTVEKYVPVSPPDNAVPATTTVIEGKSLLANSTPSADEAGKHRHKSEESNTQDKIQSQQRKVRSQDDLVELMSERGLDPSYTLPERKSQQASPVKLRTMSEPHYKLLWQRSFPCPIMALDSGDMMGDGLENLVILTMFGLHVLQPNINEVVNLISRQLERLNQSISGSEVGDEFHKLQLE